MLEKNKYIVQCLARTYCGERLNYWGACPDVEIEAESFLEAIAAGKKIARDNLAERQRVEEILVDCVIEPDGKIIRLVSFDGNMFPY